MATYCYVVESATYRCSHDMEQAIEALRPVAPTITTALLKGVEQYAAEAAILKVAGSDA